MSACERCHRGNAAPWVTPGGLVIGHLCDRCQRSADRRQRRTARVLEATVRQPAKPKPPLHACERHYPTAHAIAQALPVELLALRTRRLEADIRERWGCSKATAMKAVSLARAA